MRYLRIIAAVLLVVGFAYWRAPITVYLAGDSTMAAKAEDRRPETGWGEKLQQFFTSEAVRIENHARNGRSTRSFLAEGHWQAIINKLQPGDYVFIQFGHNDAAQDRTDRYTPPADYKANLRRFVREVRGKQAHPVLLTPVMRRRFRDGAFYDSHGEYPALVREVAAAQNVPLIDLHRSSEALIKQYGEQGSRQLFLHLAAGANRNYPQGLSDDTHFSPLGAQLIAEQVVRGLRELNLPLAAHLQTIKVAGPDPVRADITPNRLPNDSLLSAGRIAALPSKLQLQWRAYIDRSRTSRKRDLDSMNAELRTARLARWTAAPVGPGLTVTRAMTPEWFRTPEAVALANAIVSYQTPAGGWSKRIDFSRPRKIGESFSSDDSWNWIGTLDNNSTTEQLTFLMSVIQAHPQPRYLTAFNRGIDFLLEAQFPSGCWPQIYPLEGGYHDAATFNDDATMHALQVLRSVARHNHQFVSTAQRTRANAALQRGINCILNSQIVARGKKTVWGAQHDPLTLEPVKARAYEHPSLSGRESATILDFLMRIESPSPAIVDAVHAAAAWFRATAIRGFAYEPRGRLTAKDNGGPLWARFYEIGTNRPIFSDRDGVIKYDLNEIGDERRTGYLWYTDEPAATLRRYDAWARRYPVGN
jgi:PelA/Pel-15E family pectate lyase